jgi:hypothetical protein
MAFQWRGLDPRDGVTVPDWLAAPWQRLAEVTGRCELRYARAVTSVSGI